jgi:hypothetical protein
MKPIVCMKWGTKYGADYVNKLYAMVNRNLKEPFTLTCFTDDTSGITPEVITKPMPEVFFPEGSPERGWRKLGLFHPEIPLDRVPTLYLDLDVVITGDLAVFFELDGRFRISNDWNWRKPGVGNSSVFRFIPGENNHLWETWDKEWQTVRKLHRNEQEFVTANAKDLTFWPDPLCRSFKLHCLRTHLPLVRSKTYLPDNARVIIFHGDPKPGDAIAGQSAKWYRSFEPAVWLEQYWRC